MNYRVYAITNPVGKVYIGQTNNLEERMKRHNGEISSKRRSFTSKNQRPWKIFYEENFSTRKEAIEREKQLKSSRGREFLRRSLEKQNIRP